MGDNGHCIYPGQTIRSYLEKDWGLSYHRGNYYTVTKDVDIEKDHEGKINTVFIKNAHYIDAVQYVEHKHDSVVKVLIESVYI